MKKLYTIYNNVYIMLSKYREMTMITPLLSFENFQNDMKYNDYILLRSSSTVENIRGAIDNYTVIIAPESDYASKSGDFKTMLNKVLNGDKKTSKQKKEELLSKEPTLKESPEIKKQSPDEPLINLCFISETPFTSHIYKAIAKKQEELPFYAEDHLYDIFRIELFKQNMVPEQRIFDIRDILSAYYTTEHSLGAISHKDAAAVWIGARPNMIVELKQVSENAVYAYDYKLCKKAKGSA